MTIGTIILLFYIGLEAEITMLKRYLLPSTIAGVVGALPPLGLGYFGVLLLGLAQAEAIFVGIVLFEHQF